jgi:hypothetical protein
MSRGDEADVASAPDIPEVLFVCVHNAGASGGSGPAW